MSDLETTRVFRDILAELPKVEQKLLAADLDETSLLEGYKWIFSILQVGLDAYVWGDTARPRFVDIVGPYKKWGGDNADAFYQFAPIDPSRTYRVRGRRGDAAYLSLTVYGGPSDGHYSTRIVGWLNDRQVDFADDGTFELVLSPHPQDGAWIKLEPDAVCAITRDYLDDPVNGRRVEWSIEADDPPATRRETDADLAARFRAALTWVQDQVAICPLPLPDENVVDEPYPVPQVTFGWAAGDASYASGAFSLEDDQALVIEGRSPECVFWNMCLWTPYLHTYDYAYERVTVNGAQLNYEDDGSWRIVVSARDPGHPNWVSTQGHRRGRIWFRWFLPESTPDRPSARVVAVGEAAS
jgi:hypothetical protein